jgi:hypothetical protein
MLAEHVPSFGFSLEDLWQLDDDTLETRMLADFAKLALWLLRDGRAGRVLAAMHEEGREEGRVQVLVHQLTLKFGPLPEHVRTCIEQATLVDLEQWLERVLFAGSLDEVFASRQ